MTAPLVGITTYEDEALWGGWRQRAAVLPIGYVTSVVAAGGVPALLAPFGDPQAVAGHLDALIVSGGSDVDPARYGARPHPATEAPAPRRDEFEAQLLGAARRRHLPTLCICRGLQLLNVVRGGNLHQHLPELPGGAHHAPPAPQYSTTQVRVAPGSRLAGVVGSTTAAACHHHQAVDRVGSGLVAVAWSDDGTIEALEDAHAETLLAVQWHPEERDDPALFDWLIAAARSYPTGRQG